MLLWSVFFAIKLVNRFYDQTKLPIKVNESNEQVPKLSVPLQATLAVTHMVATLTTNASIAFATPAPAFIIKAFEPITTAILAAIVGGKRVETHVIISLPLVA